MKILIATDGSEFSKAAVTQACHYLLCKDDEIRLVSAFDDSPIAGEAYGMTIEYHKIAVDAFRKQAEVALQDAENIVRKHPLGKDIALSETVLTGPPEREIVDEAANWGADLIVVGSHGRGFWERQFLGSISTDVLNHAKCSVLVVRKPQGEK